MKEELVVFPLNAIQQIKLRRSVYDIPFLEKNVILWLKNGKKYSLKRMPKNQADELYNILNKQFTSASVNKVTGNTEERRVS
jgi:hypothetical protein